MKPEEIDRNPERITIRVSLASGETAQLRPLVGNDAGILGEYFIGLSDKTRSFYGPHPFNQTTADELCAAVNNAETLRLMATVNLHGRERVVGYFIVILGVRDSDRKRYDRLGISLDQATDCIFAPSVADDYQNTGLGSLMMEHLQHVLKQCGKRRIVLWGGVQERNARAVHFYEKFGFKKAGEFMSSTGGDNPARINNFDMIAML